MMTLAASKRMRDFATFQCLGGKGDEPALDGRCGVAGGHAVEIGSG